jgi:VWFA-related protein
MGALAKRVWLVLSCAVALRPGQPAAAPQAPDGVPVSISVVVTTNQAQPVRGLTPDDFVVQVDGRPQPILSVTEDSGARSIAFVVDDNFIPPLLMDRVREFVREIVGKLGPPVQFALLTNSKHVTVNLTGDRLALLDAVNKITAEKRRLPAGVATTSELTSTRDVQNHFRNSVILGTLGRAGHQLARAPGRRAIVWMSVGLPAGASTSVEKTATTLNAAGVTVYAVSVAALAALAERGYIEPNTAATLDIEEPQIPNPAFVPLRFLSLQTGGFVLLGGNPTHGGVVRLLTEMDNYYDVTFRGQIRNRRKNPTVLVAVKGEGLVVHAPHSF